MYIIIIGCGEVGSRLAKDLSSGKDNVVVIDRSRKALKKLGVRFNGRTLRGDGLDLETLEEAGITSCDVIFVLTGNEDLNLVIGQVAKRMYKVKKVVVQAHSYYKEEIFKNKELVIVNRTNLFLDKFKQCIS